MNVDRVQQGLCTKWLGRRILFTREVGSTNDWAKELAGLGAPEGTVVIAEGQSGGRGRLNREWVSPVGGLWFSVVLRPRMLVGQAVGLVFVAGLAVAQALRDLYGLGVETKWPNDVLIGGKKVCGVLTETSSRGERVNFVVVGVGVNANFVVREALPEELWGAASSLQDELGRRVGLEDLLRVVLERLESVYLVFVGEGLGVVLGEWRKFAGFLGREVVVDSGEEKFSGEAVDVDGDGALVIRFEDNVVRRILVGDVFPR
jgi:biotin-[acetyl-CoA-carboxylase] ligase BirA-like protein